MIRSICVFCGSNAGARPAYAEAAAALGRLIASRGLRLVYGGAKVGLMGALADAALGAGGFVTGVIPVALVEKEIAHSGLTELHTVGSMHERKAMMSDLSDAFLGLPGGAGTLEEIFEVWTWGQLGHHKKPAGLLNVEGFYDGLSAFLDHQMRERFVREEHRRMLIIESDPEVVLVRFASYRPPQVAKWIDRGER